MPGIGGDMLNWKEKKVYLCCGHTDMRKQINGLMTVVKESFNLDPFEKAIFVFCNRSRNRIKILEWDEDGFWLYFKRLEKGHIRWPGLPIKCTEDKNPEQNQQEDTSIMTLTTEELIILLNGVRVELKIKRNEVLERKIS